MLDVRCHEGEQMAISTARDHVIRFTFSFRNLRLTTSETVVPAFVLQEGAASSVSQPRGVTALARLLASRQRCIAKRCCSVRE